MEERLRNIARKYGLQLVVQFGSTVRGTVHPHSDVDLAVLVDRMPGSLEEQGRLYGELQTLFAGREVDVAILNRADPLFLRQVLESCRLLYGSPRTLAELRMYGFRRYQDHRRYLALEREYVNRSIRRLAPG